MAKKEAPFTELNSFLPEGCFDLVYAYLKEHKVHLTITRARASVLGDYRSRSDDKNHRISVNGNLNKYGFVITLLHEIAHLLTFEKYGHRVLSHGKEWKREFGFLLAHFISRKLFPADIEKVLLQTLHDPAASSCANASLIRVLKNYDKPSLATTFVEQIPPQGLFKIKGGKVFKKLEKRRTRYLCVEVATGKEYLFSAVYEVIAVDN
jgi:SprT protein